jgi:acetyl esterase/lipase
MSRTLLLFASLLVSLPALRPAVLHAAVPQTVAELWADFDPRKDPLETETVRQWKRDGMVLRYVRFRVGTFKGQPARIAAFYGFPEGAKERLPAILHIHGGGQRANPNEVAAMVARGYAALSLNWGGAAGRQERINAMDPSEPGDPNTDWGAVDPTQLNVPGYSSILPGPKQFCEDGEHPKNCNWYLLTLACRRGLTFLEQQPEVDPQRLGVHGFSMGGNLTMYVAGTDARVKAAVPAVGGQGWRWQPHAFLGGVAQQERIQGNVDLFRRTLSFESYAPRIRCPLLHRSATNDFHGWMDDVYRTDGLIEGQPVRHAWSPHLNHRLTPEVAVTMPLWFDHFLKGGPALPETPGSELLLSPGSPARLRVSAKSDWPVARCHVYYSVDPDPRARFWRSAEVTPDGGVFVAQLTLATADRPLFAFANVFYTLPRPVSMPQLTELRGEAIREVCLSTKLHTTSPDRLRRAGVQTAGGPQTLIDDFAHTWRDWYRLNTGHRDYWQNWTRKITDPQWQGPAGARLALTLKVAETNRIVFVVIENEWRNYRGPKRTYVCDKEIQGAPASQTVVLSAADFKNTADGVPLKSWNELDVLGVCAYYQERGQPAGPVRPWRGPLPEFQRLEWQR